MKGNEFNNHFVLKAHETGYQACNDTPIPLMENKTSRQICEMNKKHILFQAGYDFFIVTYYPCIEGCDHLSFKHVLLEQLCEKRKLLPPDRSVHFNDKFKKSIKQGFSFRERFTEVSHIYSDMTAKEYCFCITHKYTDVIIKHIEDEHDVNYESARQYISTSEVFSRQTKENLLNELFNLYKINDLKIYYKPDHINHINTVELLVKQINKKL